MLPSEIANQELGQKAARGEIRLGGYGVCRNFVNWCGSNGWQHAGPRDAIKRAVSSQRNCSDRATAINEHLDTGPRWLPFGGLDRRQACVAQNAVAKPKQRHTASDG